MASIKKDPKTNKWMVRVSYKSSDGKYKTKTKKGFSTKTEAVVYASKLETKKLTQSLDDEADMTIFADYFEKWCNTYKIGKFSKGQDLKIEHEIKLVKEFFKQTKIKDITRQKYQDYINERGTNRSRNTVEKTHSYLKKCLSYAIADGIISKDPTFGVVLHYDVEPKQNNNYLDANETLILLNYLKKDLMNYRNLMLYIALTTGLRIGEVYGLSYNDITDDSLSVNRGYDYQITKKFTKGKTKSSIRTIAITKELATTIKEYRISNQLYNRLFLFLNEKNKERITYSGISKHFRKILKELKLPIITIHGLRHSHASYLLYNNFNIGYISKRLGHANISETLNTYSHVITELEQKNNNQLKELYK